MPCKKCASMRQQEFQGELSVAFPGKERLNLSPVYVCQKTLICLDCGYTELVVDAAQLEQLRKGMEILHSKGEAAH
jgi:predicted nucleic-acid-binding Zn-ribbon protein